jgi:hypothetical protein
MAKSSVINNTGDMCIFAFGGEGLMMSHNSASRAEPRR